MQMISSGKTVRSDTIDDLIDFNSGALSTRVKKEINQFQ